MNASPEVSVVMSVYNGASHLAETLDSVLGQQDCDFEFIVIDDGSTDAGVQILDDYAARDPRLRVVHQDNTGLTRALIRGCALARGEFIARQDAGDVSLPGRLYQQVQAFRTNKALVFVSCGTRYVEEGGAFLFEKCGTGIATTPLSIIDVDRTHGVIDGPTHHGSVMLLRSAYLVAGGYREAFHLGQDWDLWYRLGPLGLFQILPDRLYQARISPTDISAGNKAVQETFARLSLASLRARSEGRSDAPMLKQASLIAPGLASKQWMARRRKIGQGCYFLAECLRRNGNSNKAQSYFLQSIRSNPLQLRAWIRLLQIGLRLKGEEQ